MIEGIDVSKYQSSKIDWTSVFNAGVKFVIARASVGMTVDEKLVIHAEGARKAGLLVGAYHYLKVRPGKPQDAAEQADLFCDAYLKAGCELRPALDCELTNNETATPAEWMTAVKTWIARVRERLNCEPLLYTYPSFWAGLGKLANDAELGTLDLWIAHYTLNPKPIVPAPWKSWLMWQYAADVGVIGKVAGIPGNVDRNRLNAELNVLKRVLPGPEPVPVPGPEMTPEVPPSQTKPVLPPVGESTSGWLSLVLKAIASHMTKHRSKQ